MINDNSSYCAFVIAAVTMVVVGNRHLQHLRGFCSFTLYIGGSPLRAAQYSHSNDVQMCFVSRHPIYFSIASAILLVSAFRACFDSAWIVL